MSYYFTWQEDDWLDELIDYFTSINAIVPTAKSLQSIAAERQDDRSDRALVIVNVAHEPDKTEVFLRELAAHERFATGPLYLVGATEENRHKWQAVCPDARVIVITGHPFEFDYGAVFAEMEARLEGEA